jgi:hypothetical protein
MRNLQILGLLGVLALIALGAQTLDREDAQRDLEGCKSNLNNLSTAMEMYSTDWSGHYPNRFDKLVPNYLKELPPCPATGSVTYEMEYGPRAPHNEEGFQDFYYLYCSGANHSGIGLAENQPNHGPARCTLGG